MEQTVDYHYEESTEEEIENGGKEEKKKIPLICIYCPTAKEYSSEDSFHAHNRSLHKKFTVTCPKSLNVVQNKKLMGVHNAEKHPQGKLRHKKPYKGSADKKKKKKTK